MLAQAQGSTDIPLLEETIGQRLEATARRLPDHEALVMPHQDVRWSYARLDAEVNRVARGLLARGIQAGDRIGVWAPNLAEWVLMQFATAKIGAIQVNINPAYRRDELAYALRQSGCRLVVAARSFKTSDYARMLGEVRGECPELSALILLDAPGQPADWAALLADGERVPQAEVAARMARLKPGDPINIQYTSGTTGAPKGATLSHRNILNNAYFTGLAMRFSERDRMCIPVPFYHCAGMVVGNLLCTVFGATMVVPAASFDPESTLQAIERERCTASMCVPTMHIAVLAHPRFATTDVSSLRTGAIGGSPCPVEVMNRLVGDCHMPEVTIVYGMTETSPVSTQTAVDDPVDKRVGSVGRVHPHVEIRIVDPDNGRVCGYGEAGEFQTRGYSVMLGYWNDPRRSADAITPEGWMRTGDLATMDEQGYVNIVGRIKDMIIRGGENIYPREIEEFLYTHPDIRDVQVIGVPDEKFGEEVMATVIMKDGAAPLTAEALRAFCRERIAHYKIPRYLEVMQEFPMTVSGKVRKVELREQMTARLGLQAVAARRTA
ncbi:AMP-binding protein [Solimonas sp. K1W22B-7]|uniref:AMP-binding protein n=1 Tax=Solimonas sp. K1W22B-7 TaxID=2303331 RepID=UPI000E337C9E|nr:AMP-binding protein [Solimonas sp. K1W22B-7]AXQ29793.1 AMP-binding protein [Solimonas sp. K1W22B-7]